MRSMDCAWYAPDSTLKVTAVSTSADDAELAAGAELAADAEVAEDAVDDWHPTRKLMAISNAEKPMHIHLLSEIDFIASPHEMKPQERWRFVLIMIIDDNNDKFIK